MRKTSFPKKRTFRRIKDFLAPATNFFYALAILFQDIYARLARNAQLGIIILPLTMIIASLQTLAALIWLWRKPKKMKPKGEQQRSVSHKAGFNRDTPKSLPKKLGLSFFYLLKFSLEIAACIACLYAYGFSLNLASDLVIHPVFLTTAAYLFAAAATINTLRLIWRAGQACYRRYGLLNTNPYYIGFTHEIHNAVFDCVISTIMIPFNFMLFIPGIQMPAAAAMLCLLLVSVLHNIYRMPKTRFEGKGNGRISTVPPQMPRNGAIKAPDPLGLALDITLVGAGCAASFILFMSGLPTLTILLSVAAAFTAIVGLFWYHQSYRRNYVCEDFHSESPEATPGPSPRPSTKRKPVIHHRDTYVWTTGTGNSGHPPHNEESKETQKDPKNTDSPPPSPHNRKLE